MSRADDIFGLAMFSVAALFLIPVVGFAAVNQAGFGLFWSSIGGGVGLAIGVRLLGWRGSVTRRSNGNAG